MRGILARRQDFVQLVVVAAVLALGVNILSSYLFALPWVAAHGLSVGVGLIMLALSGVLVFAFRQRTVELRIDASFLFDRKSKSVLEIPGYEFSSELVEVLTATFAEQKGLKAIWDREPLLDWRNHDHDADSKNTPSETPKRTRDRRSAILIREAIEYVVLDSLSMHLSSYMDAFAKKYVRKYRREDLPELLLQNRILALLSSPYEERAVFGDHAPPQPGHELIMAWGEGGAQYRRFELVLPRDTTISRATAGSLVFANRRIRLEISVEYEGYSWSKPPYEYLRTVLRADTAQVTQQLARIVFRYSVRPLSLLWRKGWEYHEWVDSFANDLEESMSIDRYLARSNWPAVALQTRILCGDQHSDTPPSPSSA